MQTHTQKLVRRADGTADTANPGGEPPPVGGDWQLPEGHYIPAKFGPFITHPRPDVELQNTARQAYAYPGLVYEIPVGVAGGSWPFKYELLQAPAGATIGETLVQSGDEQIVGEDYGVVRWTPSANGPAETFEVKVTGQDGTNATMTWTVTPDSTKFIFCDPNAPGGGDGSIGSPLTWAEVFGTTTAYNTYAGKICYFRGGTYACTGHSDTVPNGNLAVDDQNHPVVFIGYPGETPIFDWQDATKMTVNHGPDLWVSNIRMRNPRETDMGNAHYIFKFRADDRITLWRNYFERMTGGFDGEDNTAAFFKGRGSVLLSRYYNFIENTYDDFDGTINNIGNGIGGAHCYNVSYSTYEREVYKNMNTRYPIWAKVESAYTSRRGIIATEGNSGVRLFAMSFDGTQSTELSEYNELCWCKGISTGTMALQTHLGGNSENLPAFYIYRNTIDGVIATQEVDNPNCPVLHENNVYSGTVGTGSVITVTDCVEGTSDIDASGNITGATKAAYWGTRGANVA